MDDFVPKPIDVKLLERTMERWVHRAGGTTVPTVAPGEQHDLPGIGAPQAVGSQHP
jgi:hypothetical protein